MALMSCPLPTPSCQFLHEVVDDVLCRHTNYSAYTGVPGVLDVVDAYKQFFVKAIGQNQSTDEVQDWCGTVDVLIVVCG